MITGDCCQPCPDVTINVPGAPGTDGANGSAGINAFTLTTADFTLPAVNANVVVSVANSTQFALLGNLFISDGTNIGNFQVITKPTTVSLNLKFLGYTNDSAPAVVITSAALVQAGGLIGPSITTPVSIANGGTAAATKAAAQTSLGLGQNALTANSTGLTQAITNAFAEVGTSDVTVVSVGTYLILAKAVITMLGVTFAASRTITLRVRNITAGTTIATADFATQIQTTQNVPALEIQVPFVTDAAAVANDHYQLQITIDTVNSAGTLNVVSGSLVAVPLRLS